MVAACDNDADVVLVLVWMRQGPCICICATRGRGLDDGTFFRHVCDSRENILRYSISVR